MACFTHPIPIFLSPAEGASFPPLENRGFRLEVAESSLPFISALLLFKLWSTTMISLSSSQAKPGVPVTFHDIKFFYYPPQSIIGTESRHILTAALCRTEGPTSMKHPYVPTEITSPLCRVLIWTFSVFSFISLYFQNHQFLCR